MDRKVIGEKSNRVRFQQNMKDQHLVGDHPQQAGRHRQLPLLLLRAVVLPLEALGQLVNIDLDRARGAGIGHGVRLRATSASTIVAFFEHLVFGPPRDQAVVKTRHRCAVVVEANRQIPLHAALQKDVPANAHSFQFVDERPDGPLRGQFQLDLGHVDLRRQVVLHFRPSEDGDGNRLVDLHPFVVVGLQAQTREAVSFGQLQSDLFVLLLERPKDVAAAAVVVDIVVDIVISIVVALLFARTAPTATATASTPADHRLQGQLEGDEIDLADNDVVGGRFDAVLEKQIFLRQFDKAGNSRFGILEGNPNVFFVQIQNGVVAMRVLELGNGSNNGVQQGQLIVQQLGLESHTAAYLLFSFSFCFSFDERV